MIAAWVKKQLELPELAGLALDDPATTNERRRIIQNKRFLRHLYEEWYGYLSRAAETAPPGPCVELGSGGGFLKEFIPEVITSEVMPMGDVDAVFTGEALPFSDGALSGIYMVDVLHHIPRPRAFFAEAQRCLKPGAVLAMIEPYNTRWGRVVWKNFHHEPFLEVAEKVLQIAAALLIADQKISAEKLKNPLTRKALRAALLKDLFGDFHDRDQAIVFDAGGNIAVDRSILKNFITEYLAARAVRSAA